MPSAAREIVDMSSGELCIDLRFLSKAVLSLDTDVAPGSDPPSCDGASIEFHEDEVVSGYLKDRNHVTRAMAHIALHCILGHSAPNDRRSPEGLAEDMLVEYILDSLDTPHVSAAGRPDRMYIVERLVSLAGSPSVRPMAEIIASEPGWKLPLYSGMFNRDGHSSRGWDDESWKEMSEQAMVEVEGFSEKLSGRTDVLMRVLRIRNRRRHDYRDFLRRFVTRGSLPREDPDSFDPIYYTYGLGRYGNMPLMDSSETSEKRSIEEFVIAIDTSGSVMKGPVTRFLEETMNVIDQCIPRDGARIHVIQCDDMVRSDRVIGCRADLNAMMGDFRLAGGGGTDFRPAFRYVDSLVESGELKGLKGMLYFTDGLGTYPERRPGYDVAFVFCGDGYEEHAVPPWAMRLELDPDDISGQGRTGT